MLLYPDPHGPSFLDYMKREHFTMLPDFLRDSAYDAKPGDITSHGTTILALKYRDGVMMAGDRRATEGFQISSRKIEKVYAIDDYSAIAIAGAAGPCLEMVKLFKTEIEHYEKIEGEELALEGKANKLAHMIGMNLAAALQGLIVIPIFSGYHLKKGEGKIFKYDLTGGVYEEEEYYATGSGGKDAKNSLKKLYKRDADYEGAVKMSLEALYDAADEDIGTGGADLARDIFPTVKAVTAEGIKEVPEEMTREITRAFYNNRSGR